MAEEFIDLYEVLELPLDADRATLRKKINEKYLEAQRNLDHRTFQTRVKYQELFEVTLPQARYILLDEGRRHEYDRVVSAFRASQEAASAPASETPAPPPSPSLGKGSTEGFKLIEEAPAPAPVVSPLPTSMNGEISAEERDELWKKWKAGLGEALAREEQDPAHARLRPSTPASTSPTPRSTSPSPTATSEPQTSPIPTARPEQPIAFDFNAVQTQGPPKRPERPPIPVMEPLLEDPQEQISEAEIKRRQDDRRRQLSKEILENVNMKGWLIGSLSAGAVASIALFVSMSHFFPAGQAPQLPISSGIGWAIGLLLFGGITFLGGHLVSRSMRRNTAMQLTSMPYEQLLRRAGRNI